MPKFTDRERNQIRQSLLSRGRELFIQYGLAKTSIDEIVQACGIGKGTFYKFFDSKEALFYEILKNEEGVRDQLLGQLLSQDLPPKELLSSYFHKALDLVEENAFLQLAFDDGQLERVVRKLPTQLVKASVEEDIERGMAVIHQLINRGVIPADDPTVVVGVIRAVMMMRLFKEKLGSELFPDIMDRIIDYVSEGLTRQP